MSSLHCVRSEDGCIVRVLGPGTLRVSPAFKAFVGRYLSGHRTSRVTVDLSDCDYLDSTFLGCLIGLHKLGGEGDRRLRFFAKDERCRRLFAASMLDRYLCIVDRLPDTTEEVEVIPDCELDAREFGQHVMQCHQRLAAAGGEESDEFASIVEQLAKELKN